jgi:Arylsulfotransferase (ASST)
MVSTHAGPQQLDLYVDRCCRPSRIRGRGCRQAEHRAQSRVGHGLAWIERKNKPHWLHGPSVAELNPEPRVGREPGAAGRRPSRLRLATVLVIGAACAVAVACISACSGGPVRVTGPVVPTGTAPPPLTVLTGAIGNANGSANGNGDIFLGPAGGSYPAGPEIVTTTGQVVWFHRLPAGEVATDFRTQTYLGRPVLTWFQSEGQGAQGGPGGATSQVAPSGPSGTDYIYNDRYQQIATLRAGNGDETDFHEFLITPQNTALILADTVTTANLASIGGPADQQVINGIVQEIDIPTGRVLFQWDSAGHVPYADSYMSRPSSPSTPWDWFHINAVHLDTDGNLLVDSRNTWTTFKVNRQTGQIMWQLGGKHSSFTLRAAPGQVLDQDGKIFAWQHDPEAIGGGEYTFFDDESSGHLLRASRAVTVQLDLANKVATLVTSDNQPEGKVAQVMGNAQTTADHDLFVGWGALPYISEFSSSGKLVFNAQLPAGVSTYRAYLLPWSPPS